MLFVRVESLLIIPYSVIFFVIPGRFCFSVKIEKKSERVVNVSAIFCVMCFA